MNKDVKDMLLLIVLFSCSYDNLNWVRVSCLNRPEQKLHLERTAGALNEINLFSHGELHYEPIIGHVDLCWCHAQMQYN